MIGVGVNIWQPDSGGLSLRSCIKDGVIRLLYDATFGVNTVGPAVVQWIPSVGGTASDILVPVGPGNPTYLAVDAGFGGRPSVTGVLGGASGLQSAVPATAVSVVQPNAIIAIQRTFSAVAAIQYVYDSSNVGGRQWARITPANWAIGSTTQWVPVVMGLPVPPIAGQLCLMAHEFNSPNSMFYRRTNLGVVATTAGGTTGVQSLNGFTLFNNYVMTAASGDAGLTAIMAVTNFSANDLARVVLWCQAKMGWA